MLKLKYLNFLFCRLWKEATEEVTLKKKKKGSEISNVP